MLLFQTIGTGHVFYSEKGEVIMERPRETWKWNLSWVFQGQWDLIDLEGPWALQEAIMG